MLRTVLCKSLQPMGSSTLVRKSQPIAFARWQHTYDAKYADKLRQAAER
jgi:hypothetical protein